MKKETMKKMEKKIEKKDKKDDKKMMGNELIKNKMKKGKKDCI